MGVKSIPQDLQKLWNEFFATKPSNVDAVFTNAAMYYRRWMLRKIFAIFDFQGFPDWWEKDYYLEHQFLDGVIGVTDTEVGVVALKCGYTGINIYNHPTELIFTNPVLGSFRRTIGKDGVLVKLQWDFHGIQDMLDRYSSLLAMCDSSVAVSLMNSKVAFIGLADSKAQADTMKLIYDKISCGEPAVFTKKDPDGGASVKDMFIFNNVKQNFVADDILVTQRKIINMFLTEIGITTANTEKKERLVTDEANAANVECYMNVQHWLDCLNEGFRQVNDMFPEIDVTVSLNATRVAELLEPSGITTTADM